MAPLILIVDDNEDAREILAMFLHASGFHVTALASAHHIVDSAALLNPAAIILDLSMPGVNGFEAARRLRADERTRCVPIIMLTGHGIQAYEEQARRAGCDDFLVKPADPRAVIQAIRRALEAKR